MTTKQTKQDSSVEHALRAVSGSTLLLTVLVSAAMAAFGFVIAVLEINIVLGAMFGIWGGTGVILGSGAYLLIRLHRGQSERGAEAGREFFSQ